MTPVASCFLTRNSSRSLIFGPARYGAYLNRRARTRLMVWILIANIFPIFPYHIFSCFRSMLQIFGWSFSSKPNETVSSFIAFLLLVLRELLLGRPRNVIWWGWCPWRFGCAYSTYFETLQCREYLHVICRPLSKFQGSLQRLRLIGLG